MASSDLLRGAGTTPKFGLNLLLWATDVRGETYLPLFERIKSMGYDGVEVPVLDPDEKAYKRLGQHLDNLGLERTVVSIRRPEFDPISSDAGVRAAGHEHLAAIIESCACLGARLLVGPQQAALGVVGRPANANEWRWATESARAACEVAQEANVVLAYEPLNRFESYLFNTVADGLRFVEDVNHPNCRLMYDTFHAHIEEQDVARAIAKAAPRLAHVHISESDRGIPGRGQVHWSKTFSALRTLGYSGWLTVEAFGMRLPDLAAATCIWRRTFETEELLAEESINFLHQNCDVKRP
ncbi:MAG: sugar phosphate isomerase/epimerase [Deltaproteobacteria bacterium]|nr:sugar phosphate isomerase/epimerase [Deltaproteobacteria bacterium]